MIDETLLCFTSMLTENVFSAGAMKREILYVRSVIRYVYLLLQSLGLYTLVPCGASFSTKCIINGRKRKR